MTAEEEKIIQMIRETGRKVVPPGGQIWLYGSRARGDAHADSDWDVLILIDGFKATGEDFDRFAYPFVDYGWSVGEQIHPLIYSYIDWEKRSFTPFYKNVQAEGISLCH